MAARVKKYTNKICMDNHIVCVHIMAILLNGLKIFLDDIVCHMAVV